MDEDISIKFVKYDLQMIADLLKEKVDKKDVDKDFKKLHLYIRCLKEDVKLFLDEYRSQKQTVTKLRQKIKIHHSRFEIIPNLRQRCQECRALLWDTTLKSKHYGPQLIANSICTHQDCVGKQIDENLYCNDCLEIHNIDHIED